MRLSKIFFLLLLFSSGFTKPYVTCAFDGQLGNQLFIVSCCYALAKENSLNLVIAYNTLNPLESMYLNTFFKTFKNIPDHLIPKSECIIYSEKYGLRNCWLFNPDIIVSKFNNYYLDGYFQNEKYFKKYKKELKKLFIIPGQFKRIDRYFIHVRRGDYTDGSQVNYHIDYESYFTKAIEYITLSDPYALFYVVSDDIPFCKNYKIFQSNSFSFMELNTVDTLHFMSQCSKGGICSNSSFSWWGSYLNFNNSKIVVMPRQWMNNSNIFDVWPENTVII